MTITMVLCLHMNSLLAAISKGENTPSKICRYKRNIVLAGKPLITIVVKRNIFLRLSTDSPLLLAQIVRPSYPIPTKKSPTSGLC